MAEQQNTYDDGNGAEVFSGQEAENVNLVFTVKSPATGATYTKRVRVTDLGGEQGVDSVLAAAGALTVASGDDVLRQIVAAVLDAVEGIEDGEYEEDEEITLHRDIVAGGGN